MKKLILSVILASSLFVSCDEDSTGGVSRITNYPLIDVIGDDPIFVPQGGTYTDPGAIATDVELKFHLQLQLLVFIEAKAQSILR